MDDEDMDMLDKAKKPNKVTIRIHCQDLMNVELISTSDPFAIFYLKGESDKVWRRIGQTETQMNKLDPQFETEFSINYYFEKNQRMKIEIFHEEESGMHQLIGTYEEGMNKLLTNSKKCIKGELIKPQQLAAKSGKKRSMITVFAEPVGESNVEIKFQADCKLVSKKRTKLQYLANCCR